MDWYEVQISDSDGNVSKRRVVVDDDARELDAFAQCLEQAIGSYKDGVSRLGEVLAIVVTDLVFFCGPLGFHPLEKEHQEFIGSAHNLLVALQKWDEKLEEDAKKVPL